jgi:hypothetical protein
MLTGTYLVKKDKHRFSNGRVDPICSLCGVGDEDIEHMLTRCFPLHCIRRINLQDSKNWSSRILELTHGNKHLIQWNH